MKNALLLLSAVLIMNQMSLAQARVGIGTNTPFSMLTVSDETDWQFTLSNPGPQGSIWNIGASNNTWNAGGDKFVISRNFISSDANFTITGDGLVGINNTNPLASLHVGIGQGIDSRIQVGTAEWLQDGGSFEIEIAATLRSNIDAFDNLGTPEKRWKNLYYFGALLQTSDRRLKTNIRQLQIEEAANCIYQLQPVTYTYLNPGIDPIPQTGLIAQDMQMVLPHLVYDPAEHPVRDEGPDGTSIITYGTGPLSINYTGLITYLVATVQQQHLQLQKMQLEIEELKAVK